MGTQSTKKKILGLFLYYKNELDFNLQELRKESTLKST